MTHDLNLNGLFSEGRWTLIAGDPAAKSVAFAKSLFVQRCNLLHLSQYHFALHRKRSDSGPLIANAEEFFGAGTCRGLGPWVVAK